MEEIKGGESDKPRRGVILNIIFLILLLLAISALINSTITIYKYKDMLKNPLGYNLEKFDIATCSCIDNSGKTVEIYSLNYTIPIKSPSLKIT